MQLVHVNLIISNALKNGKISRMTLTLIPTGLLSRVDGVAGLCPIVSLNIRKELVREKFAKIASTRNFPILQVCFTRLQACYRYNLIHQIITYERNAVKPV